MLLPGFELSTCGCTGQPQDRYTTEGALFSGVFLSLRRHPFVGRQKKRKYTPTVDQNKKYDEIEMDLLATAN